VKAQIAWAATAGRKDEGEQFWDDAADATVNPHLEKFKEDLEQEKHSVSPEGRCEKVLCRVLKKNTWGDSGSYTQRSNFPWFWYVQNMLPRFFSTTETWFAPRPGGIVITTCMRGYRIRRLCARGFRK